MSGANRPAESLRALRSALDVALQVEEGPSAALLEEAADVAESLRLSGDFDAALDLLTTAGRRTRRLRAEMVLCAIGASRDDLAREVAAGDPALERLVAPWLFGLKVGDSEGSTAAQRVPRNATPRVRELHALARCASLSSRDDFRPLSAVLRRIGTGPEASVDGKLVLAGVTLAKAAHGTKVVSDALDGTLDFLERATTSPLGALLREPIASDLSYLGETHLRLLATRVARKEAAKALARSRQPAFRRSDRSKQPTATKLEPTFAEAAVALARLCELPRLTPEAAAMRIRDVGWNVFESLPRPPEPSGPKSSLNVKTVSSRKVPHPGAMELYDAFGALAAKDTDVLNRLDRAKKCGADPVEVARGMVRVHLDRYLRAARSERSLYEAFWKAIENLAAEVRKGPDGELGHSAVLFCALELRYELDGAFAPAEPATNRGRLLDWVPGLRGLSEASRAPLWARSWSFRLDPVEAFLCRNEFPERALDLVAKVIEREPKDARMWALRIHLGQRLGKDVTSWVIDAAQLTGERPFREQARKLTPKEGSCLLPPFAGMEQAKTSAGALLHEIAAHFAPLVEAKAPIEKLQSSLQRLVDDAEPLLRPLSEESRRVFDAGVVAIATAAREPGLTCVVFRQAVKGLSRSDEALYAAVAVVLYMDQDEALRSLFADVASAGDQELVGSVLSTTQAIDSKLAGALLVSQASSLTHTQLNRLQRIMAMSAALPRDVAARKGLFDLEDQTLPDFSVVDYLESTDPSSRGGRDGTSVPFEEEDVDDADLDDADLDDAAFFENIVETIRIAAKMLGFRLRRMDELSPDELEGLSLEALPILELGPSPATKERLSDVLWRFGFRREGDEKGRASRRQKLDKRKRDKKNRKQGRKGKK